MTLTLAQCINLRQELAAHEPPARIVQALDHVLGFVAGGCTPPSDLLNLVQSWLGRKHQQDRYGK